MAKRKILSVDDDGPIREMIKQILDDANTEVETVGSGYRAMVRFKEDKFDLVLLDIMMPGLDGIAMIEHLKELQPGVPVIMVTGFTDEKLHQEAIARGATAVVTKPFGANQLLEAVNKALGS